MRIRWSMAAGLVALTMFTYGYPNDRPSQGRLRRQQEPPGLPGQQGPKGLPGPMGPEGPQGPSAESIFISLTLAGRPSVSVDPQNPLIFTNVNAMQGGVSYDSLSGQITLEETGTYFFCWGFTASPSNFQTALRINGRLNKGGLIMPGSQIESLINNMQSAATEYTTTTPHTTIELINNQPSGGGTLNFITSTASSQSAYLLIKKIY